MKYDFFQAIRKKREVDPSSDFDQKFWSRFDAEFAPPPSILGRLISTSLLVPRSPAFATAFLLLIASYIFFANRNQMEPGLGDGSVALESLQLVEDLEFAEGLEDDLLVLADDEDWEDLLQGVVDET
jgi:hypothetical protein